MKKTEAYTHALKYTHNRRQTPLVAEVFWCDESLLDKGQSGYEVIVWRSEAERAMGTTRQIAGTRRFYPCKPDNTGSGS